MAKQKELFREVKVSFTRRWRLEEKVCPQCGSKFVGVKKQRYCSRACQNKANYQRHANRYRKDRIARYRQQKE